MKSFYLIFFCVCFLFCFRCLVLVFFHYFERGMARQRNYLSAAWKTALCVLCQQLWLEFTCVLTSSLLTENCIFNPIIFGCELCTGRHWKGAIDHCCEISDPNFIISCAIAEFCMCVTPAMTNHWAVSNKHPCMNSAAWTVFCNSHGCTVLFFNYLFCHSLSFLLSCFWCSFLSLSSSDLPCCYGEIWIGPPEAVRQCQSLKGGWFRAACCKQRVVARTFK